jgi:hypothetical protein
MLFGTYQSGGAPELALNCTDVRRGDPYVLMDGTETVASGSSSVHFAAGSDPGGVVNSSFYVEGAPGTTWTIQGSNGPSTADTPGSPTSTITAFGATFLDLGGSETEGNGAYTDVGSATWYRFHIVTLGSGDQPLVRVRRS